MMRLTLLIASLVLMGNSVVFAFDLQGHRGARGLMPENTLPAFAAALSIGVTTLELDTAVTSDSVVVVSHNPVVDKDLARSADGSWLASSPLIKEMTFEDLQQFDLGRLNPDSRAAKRFAQQQPVDGTRIPSLAHVFELAKRAGNDAVRFNIETKINPAEPDKTVSPQVFVNALLKVIAEYQLEDRVSIQSFDWRTLQAVQKANDKIETVYLTAQQNWLDNVSASIKGPSIWTAGFNYNAYDKDVAKMIVAAGGSVWSPFFRDLTKQRVDNAHSAGLKVVPWTVNDEASMGELIDMGVDGLISDYPDKLRAVMKARSMKLPTPTPIDG